MELESAHQIETAQGKCKQHLSYILLVFFSVFFTSHNLNPLAPQTSFFLSYYFFLNVMSLMSDGTKIISPTIT